MPPSLPPLTPFLLRPVECDPTTCRHPRGSLPPHDRLSAAIKFLYWKEFDSRLARFLPTFDALLDHNQYPIDPDFDDTIYRTRARDDIDEHNASQFVSYDCDRLLDTITKHEEMVRKEYTSMLEDSFATLLKKIVGRREAEESVDRCVHDVLNEVEAYLETMQLASFDLPKDSAGLEREDWLDFDRRMTRGVRLANMNGLLWSQDEAQDRVAKLAMFPRAVFKSEVKQYAASNRFLGGHRLLLHDHAHSPLSILVELLLQPESAAISNLIPFFSARTRPLRMRFALQSASSLWTPQQPRFKPPEPGYAVYNSAPKRSPSPSDPSREIHHNNILFPEGRHYLPYRICSPIHCTNQPPLVENYIKVESLIGRITDLRFANEALVAPEEDMVTLRTRMLSRFFKELPSFKHKRDVDKSRLLTALDGALYDTLLNTREVHCTLSFMEVFASVGALLRDLHGGEGCPCLCALTHLVTELEEEATKLATALDIRLQQEIILPAVDIDELHEEFVEMAEYAEKGSIWRGDWRSKLSPIVDIILGPLDELITRQENRLGTVVLLRHLFENVGAARLLEEATFALELFEVDKLSAEGLDCDRGESFARALRVTESSGDILRIEYDVQCTGNYYEPEEQDAALMYYALTTLLHPAGWSARLNAAAMRFRQPDSRYDRYHYSRAVYDCTVVLHFAGPNFKAYYRRGLALARLKLWQKAVLDFEQALLVEPKNALILQEMAAAKRHLVSR